MVIESDGHGKVADYPRMRAEVCNGCGQHFELSDSFEALVDRLTKRGYLIHTTDGCWERLADQLSKDSPWKPTQTQGESNANLTQ